MYKPDDLHTEESWADPEKISAREAPDLFKPSTHYTEGHTNLPLEASKRSNCFSKGSLPGFLRKPIATYDFPRGRVGVGLGWSGSPVIDIPFLLTLPTG